GPRLNRIHRPIGFERFIKGSDDLERMIVGGHFEVAQLQTMMERAAVELKAPTVEWQNAVGFGRNFVPQDQADAGIVEVRGGSLVPFASIGGASVEQID